MRPGSTPGKVLRRPLLRSCYYRQRQLIGAGGVPILYAWFRPEFPNPEFLVTQSSRSTWMVAGKPFDVLEYCGARCLMARLWLVNAFRDRMSGNRAPAPRVSIFFFATSVKRILPEMIRTALLLLIATATLFAATTSEFIYESAPFPSCHASTIVETAPGEFLAAWFGGTDEGKPDVAIWSSRKSKGQWSAPVELAREPNIPTFNPVLFFSADKTLWMYYKFGPSPSQWTGARRSSRDAGQTWSPVEYLAAGVLGPIKNKPLVLTDGTIVSGTSVESYQAWASWVERSTDNGKTWTKHGPIVYPGEPWGTIQPAIVSMGSGHLRMFVRSTPRIGRICASDSTDGGRTWTDLKPTGLPNPNSGIDAVALRDGRILLVYNHTGKGRSPLNLAVSRDGDRWNSFLALETETGEFSYPAIIQGSDGSVHVTYTWNRKKIRHVQVPLAAIPQ